MKKADDASSSASNWPSLPQAFFRFTLLRLLRSIYRIKALNAENMPATGGVLMISNHVSYIDSFILTAASPRPVRFVIFDHYLKVFWMAWFLRLFGVIPIAKSRAKDAIKATADAVQSGHVVCIFPEGQLTRTGVLNELKKGFEIIAKKANAPVLPVYMDAMWGSIFSFERGKYFYKLPHGIRHPLTVNFGKPMAPEEATVEHARGVLQDLSAEAFAARDDLSRTLPEAIIRSLKRRKGRDCLVDYGKSRRVMSRAVTLSTALTLAKRWRDVLPAGDERREGESGEAAAAETEEEGGQRRLGILLPLGGPAVVVNLAAILAGRVPVNLPFEACLKDAAVLGSVLEKNGLKTVITSRAFSPLLEKFEGEATFRDMRAEIDAAGLVAGLAEKALAKFEPAWMTLRRTGLQGKRTGGPKVDDIAFAYVTESGDELVELSHRNILCGVNQLTGANFIAPNETVLSEAPLNTAAGVSFSLWYPVLKQGIAVNRSLASRETPLGEVLADEEVDLLVCDDSLFAQLSGEDAPDPEEAEYLKRILVLDPAQPQEDIDALEEAMGVAVCRGWAPDEFGCVVALSMIDPQAETATHQHQAGRKPDAAGRLLPGITARLGSEEAASLSGRGELLLRGDSLPRNRTENGWASAGLRAGFDLEGFLLLDGAEPENAG